MFLLDSIFSLFTLRWRQQESQPRPLPAFIKRQFVDTHKGKLELLVCKPKHASSSKTEAPALFFIHGGYGSAGVWLEWMIYLHEQGYEGYLYAFSVRNHGASYTLPYYRMVFQTTFQDIQDDTKSCLNQVWLAETTRNPAARRPILIGHSSGGGLAQQILSDGGKSLTGHVQASALCLVDAIPSYGSYDIYWNWLKHDPWFPLRSMLHLQHPTSPLSTNRLVYGAFFGHRFPYAQTQAFRQWMPPFESMGWPVGMMGGSFWTWLKGVPNQWLSTKDIAKNIVDVNKDTDQVCIIIGEEDMMYRPWMWERQCFEYRQAIAELALDTSDVCAREPSETSKSSTDITRTLSSGGVRLVLVKDSGHHVQNDVNHEQAAEALLKWARQV